jgi:hypothetical protein
MTAAVRAFVTQLLARLSSLETRLEVSERRVAELEKENRDLRPVRRKPDPQAGNLLFKVIAARTSPSGAAVVLVAGE